MEPVDGVAEPVPHDAHEAAGVQGGAHRHEQAQEQPYGEQDERDRERDRQARDEVRRHSTEHDEGVGRAAAEHPEQHGRAVTAVERQQQPR